MAIEALTTAQVAVRGAFARTLLMPRQARCKTRVNGPDFRCFKTPDATPAIPGPWKKGELPHILTPHPSHRGICLTPRLRPQPVEGRERSSRGCSRDLACRFSMWSGVSSLLLSRMLGRVMGAWWPPRSSKPLSDPLLGRGMFDSYPLRHLERAKAQVSPLGKALVPRFCEESLSSVFVEIVSKLRQSLRQRLPTKSLQWYGCSASPREGGGQCVTRTDS